MRSKTFEGTVLSVTHDRWFMRNFDRFIVFRQDGYRPDVPGAGARSGVTKFNDEMRRPPLGDGRYEATISPDWRIVRGANGGHLAAMLLRAMSDELG